MTYPYDEWKNCVADFASFTVKKLGEVDYGEIVLATVGGPVVACFVLKMPKATALIPLAGGSEFEEFRPSGETHVAVVSGHVWMVEPRQTASDPEQHDERGKLIGRLWLRLGDRGLVYADANEQIRFASFERHKHVRTLNTPTFFFDRWRLMCGNAGLSSPLAEFGYFT